jgi:hypothetical protein
MGASSDTPTNTGAKTALAVTSTAVSDPTAFKLGANVNTINWWDGSRPFANMIYGTSWSMQNTNPWGGAEDVPAADLDANGWVTSVPAGYRVMRGLSVPVNGGDFICRFQGNGTISVTGPVSNVTTGAGFTKFTIAATYPNPQSVGLTYFVDPTNYIRNIDCREASAPTTDLLAPEFVSSMSGFKVIRFMKWQPATEGNYPVSWATRNKPGDADYTKSDGVPVEVMVATANQLNADPWFTIPWNADDDYITRFATYVRDNLAPGHQAYVEVSNEVWNPGYAVWVQAKNEAIAEGLKSAEDGVTPVTNGSGERYAEKTQHVMQVWSAVFAGQMNRTVRVFAWQHVNPYWANLLLKYQNTYQYVDALATAPYWGHEAPTWTVGLSLDTIMSTSLPALITDSLNFATQQKTVAQTYGLRYVSYEAGQHIVLPDNPTLELQIERDPRMYGLYKQFISGWQSQISDTLTMFALTGPVTKYGAWGVSEYAGQPLTQTPKKQAIADFLTTSTTTPTTAPTTQVCPDGSVISLTSTCPTTTPTPTTQVCPDGTVISLTSTCPTTTKRRNAGKGGGSTKNGTITA